ncbi:PREDICTED: uncharacterized protein LOC108361079 [Rhagoletis zephyria]|uniref:uncharacterized protein LOC108361079 n=1 Tax=Rhagoletis zephyria TaxID=28612 RepID=UPI0008113ED9|nr:PREDICTED: uncharacterized protein LOC108361079 [Rhagoletis zephyria]
MVGPFMQGVLLMGIIYWYSKGMLSLINDYYRSEIQRKILTGEPLNESSDFIHVDQIVEHRLGQIKAMEEQQQPRLDKAKPPMIDRRVSGKEGSQTKRQRNTNKDELNLFICRGEKRLLQFYRLVEQTLNICLLNERMS